MTHATTAVATTANLAHAVDAATIAQAPAGNPRLALAMELHTALLGNLEALLVASRSMTIEQQAKWLIKVGGISLSFQEIDGMTHTLPASADTATLMDRDQAQELAPRMQNHGGDLGVAMPYLAALNEDILKCAKALHECDKVMQSVVLEAQPGHA